MVVLRQPPAARRFLAFACLMPLAVLPSDIFLSQSWIDFVEDTRAAVESRQRHHPVRGDASCRTGPTSCWSRTGCCRPSASRCASSDADGIILPPKGYNEWVPFHPEEPPNMGRFYWRR